MIKLIKNEILKINIIKIIILCVILIASVFIIVYVNKDFNGKDIFNTSIYLIPFLGVVICILFGGIMSNEFQNGTFKIYLTKPIKRSEILLSKILMMYLIVSIFIALIILSYLTCFIIFKIHFNSYYLISKFLLYSIPLFFIATFILFLSLITRSTAVSVGISLFTLLLSGLISEILFGINIKLIEYTFLPYLDFSIFENLVDINSLNYSLGLHLSINNGVIIIIFYSIILILCSFIIFNKKDISN